ncbi:pyridoxal phosphate-dependent aminotransferase [Sphingorhabdus soli]|uniref:Aminotransferase n=1 Tax=Flavisphingopyxis soli TaxID=2601267 RepID=A0A5C6UKH4_9SPHN|nr:pyridoxal phosphate-dependent aminotransferase [Sphingorhabdus soli]TXC73583.1 pyridoxal phosphate-dependent aminotransferase [Sphingorhabdus soli]
MDDHRLSAAIGRIEPSPTLAITARAAAMKADGIDVISLSAGEPDFDTPDFVKQAAIAAIEAGQTKYTAVGGTPALKAAVVAKFARENRIDYSPPEVIVGVGGKQVLFNAILATVGPGDEVIVPAPYWVSYPDIVRFAGGSVVAVPAGREQGYKVTPEQIAAAITPATRWVIFNSPSNPTGAAYSGEELAALGAVLRDHPHVMAITDDMYEHIWYADTPFATLAEVCPDLKDRILTVNGCSKAYAMTGWRIGFAGGPRWLIAAMTKLQSQSTSNACSIAQAAALAALDGPKDFLAERNAAFRARRDLVVERLDAIDGLACPSPEGAFYVYPDASGLIGRATPEGVMLSNDADLAEYLLAEARVAVVPGAAFGLSPAFRVSYATSREILETACERIARACAKLG